MGTPARSVIFQRKERAKKRVVRILKGVECGLEPHLLNGEISNIGSFMSISRRGFLQAFAGLVAAAIVPDAISKTQSPSPDSQLETLAHHISDTEWHHVAIVVDHEIATIYVDGVVKITAPREKATEFWLKVTHLDIANNTRSPTYTMETWLKFTGPANSYLSNVSLVT